MSYNLFLDDIRQPIDAFDYMRLPEYNTLQWAVVRNYDDFVKCVEKYGVPDNISFDHDLADEHYDPELYGSETYNKVYDEFEFKTGYDCAKWFINYCDKNNKELPYRIYIHTQNPAGGLNIKSLFDTYNKIKKMDT